jgi:hypothetical protein
LLAAIAALALTPGVFYTRRYAATVDAAITLADPSQAAPYALAVLGRKVVTDTYLIMLDGSRFTTTAERQLGVPPEKRDRITVVTSVAQRPHVIGITVTAPDRGTARDVALHASSNAQAYISRLDPLYVIEPAGHADVRRVTVMRRDSPATILSGLAVVGFVAFVADVYTHRSRAAFGAAEGRHRRRRGALRQAT